MVLIATSHGARSFALHRGLCRGRTVCTLQADEHTQECVRAPEGAFVGRAFYGDVVRAKGLDVTVKVRDLQAKNKTLRADNSLFGDPVVGVRKVLFVDCAFPWFPSATELTRNTVISTQGESGEGWSR